MMIVGKRNRDRQTDRQVKWTLREECVELGIQGRQDLAKGPRYQVEGMGPGNQNTQSYSCSTACSLGSLLSFSGIQFPYL